MLFGRQLGGTPVAAPLHSLTQPQPVRRVLICRAASSHHIAVLPGDGIGPEITKVALQALTAAGRAEGASFSYEEAHIGGAAIDATGQPLPKETLDVCKASDAVLLAAIGGCALAEGRRSHSQSLRLERHDTGLRAMTRGCRAAATRLHLWRCHALSTVSCHVA